MWPCILFVICKFFQSTRFVSNFLFENNILDDYEYIIGVRRLIFPAEPGKIVVP